MRLNAGWTIVVDETSCGIYKGFWVEARWYGCNGTRDLG